MDGVLLARLHFTLTIMFHYLFPQLTIGMSWLIVVMMNRYRKSGAPEDRALARFWIDIFALLFVLGVATGITMEFQFGTNWAQYSRFVGDIFGAPLAAEVIFSFFLESTFLSLLVFGWGRVSRNVLWFSSLMVAAGATLSAFWIVAANSWMQTPAGFAIEGGRAVLTDFRAAVFNPSTLPRFLHTVTGTLVAGSFLVMGIAAWYLLRGRHTAFARRSLRMALMMASVSSMGMLFLGHYHAIQVSENQPEKLAVYEGLYETMDGAPLLLFGIPDEDTGRIGADIRLPGMLSFLVSGRFDTTVTGLDAFPREEWPPLVIPFFSFHLMVGLGFFFIALTLVGSALRWRGSLEKSRWYLWALVAAAPLPIAANELGWAATEVGRQPWIVYRVMRTSDAISATVPPGQVLATLLMFAGLYLLLLVLGLFLLRRMIVHGPTTVEGGAR